MRETKGVTLISLIITIIILLILLGLTDLILPDDLFNKAKEVDEMVNAKLPDLEDELPDITEDENGEISSNYPPTLSVSVNNITTTGVYIMASVQDADGDSLEATLEINGKTYTRTGATPLTSLWTISNLTPHTTYPYTVTATDGIKTVKETGSFITKNNPPVIETCGTQNVTSTEVEFVCIAKDTDGDSLSITLYIDGEEIEIKSEPDGEISSAQQPVFTLDGLESNTTYSYEITVQDRYGGNDTETGEFTTAKCNCELEVDYSSFELFQCTCTNSPNSCYVYKVKCTTTSKVIGYYLHCTYGGCHVVFGEGVYSKEKDPQYAIHNYFGTKEQLAQNTEH